MKQLLCSQQLWKWLMEDVWTSQGNVQPSSGTGKEMKALQKNVTVQCVCFLKNDTHISKLHKMCAKVIKSKNIYLEEKIDWILFWLNF